jgi:hypothetical protein
MKNKNQIAIAISLLFLGVATFFIVKGAGLSKKKKEEPTPPTPKKKATIDVGGTISEGIGTPSQTWNENAPFEFPIKKGDSGNNVRNLQLLLLKYDNKILPKYGADNDFGSETENALNTILKKKVVSSQDDIEAIKNEIRKKLAFQVSANMSLAPLGITLYK